MVSRLILNLRGADPAHTTRVPQISGSNGSNTRSSNNSSARGSDVIGAYAGCFIGES